MKNKVINILKMIKSNKRIKYITIVTVMLLFISIIGYSLSFFNRDKVNLVANIKVNDLSFNITTNSGTSDDRILHLKAGKTESFNIIITNLNKISTKYELIYEVCSDEKCTNKLNELPEDVEVGLNSSLTNEVSGTINGKKSVYVNLLTENKTESDYYIKLNLNAGYVWNDLALVNQFDIFSKMTSIIAYVDDVEVKDYPSSCNYITTIVGYKNNKEITLKDAFVTCDESTNEWKISYVGLVDKVKIMFKTKPVRIAEYVTKLNKTNNGLEVDDTTDSNLRYVGASPKNYLKFNNETWRIIGVFDTYNADTGKTEKLVKIIRNDSLGQYSWDSSDSSVNSGYGVNEWSQADLMTELNTDYIDTNKTSGTTYWYNGEKNTQSGVYFYGNNIKSDYLNMIVNSRWNLGGIAASWETVGVLDRYNAERGTEHIDDTFDTVTRTDTWNGKIALMYASDYIYASTYSLCRSNPKGYVTVNNEMQYYCKNENWLYTGLDTFTLSPGLDNGAYVFTAFTFGHIGNGMTYDAYWVRPTLYLKSNVMVVGGSGEVDNPYKIELGPSFVDDSWETIANNIKNGYGYGYLVGEEKEVSIGGTNYTVRVANNSTPDECKGENFSQSACGFVVEFVDILERKVMNSSSTNKGGWPATAMRSYLNNTFITTLPNDLQSVIITTKTVSGHGSTSGETNFTSDDKIYLLAIKEIGFDNSYDSAKDNTRILDYYVGKSNNDRLKKYNNYSNYPWWTRSAPSTGNIGFWPVISGKVSDSYSASYDHGVAPAFRIG